MMASLKIESSDPRYAAVVDKRFNKRFAAKPDYVRLVSSTEQVIAAVDEAVAEKLRVVVTSGGHCLEGFVADPDVRVIIDTSPMRLIYHDVTMRAIAVEAGATVGQVHRALFDNWGTLIPLGEWTEIGMGGHVVGGAFGFLCRELGLAADYLYAVEVVTVGANGKASAVVATREVDDPNRELWWAHTGGGGGNFGIVTRYWFRSPTTNTDDPAKLLPPAPASITTFGAEWSWSDLTEAQFARLVQNYGAWCEANSDAASPNARLWSLLMLHRKQFGKIIFRGVSTAGADAEQLWERKLRAMSDGVGDTRNRTTATLSWLEFALNPFPDLFATPPGGVSSKVKDALLKKGLNARQSAVACDYLTRADHDVMGGVLGFVTYGGKINSIAPDATATAQRDAIIDLACNVGWMDPGDAEKNLAWVRAFYHELFAETGGVPAPSDAVAGAFINHPDVDLADPARNGSGVPWSTIYYRENYPRLQKVKARWDPHNVFHHALSIRA